MTDSADKLLSMRGITKRFPGVVALSNVQLELARGEVLALMGENGAGKSTLMKILGGAHLPDEGELRIDGHPVVFGGIADAKRAGIALIHQELMPAGNLDIAGNIFLGNEPRRWGGILDRSKMKAGARRLLQRVGLALSPTTSMSLLTAGQMQMVEIAKALAQDARVLIMDEPTSSLTLGETQQLFKIIKDLRAAGVGIIYISHRLDEIFEVADRISVLRDGKYVGDLQVKQATHTQVVSMMVGRALSAWFPDKVLKTDGPVVLRVRDLVVPGTKTPISFEARAGEILGFAGLVGSGRTELMEVLFGVHRAAGGSMSLEEKPYAPSRTRDAIDRGVYLAPEDRKRHGLVLPMSIAQNISLPDVGHYKPRFWLQRGTERRVAQLELDRMRIKAPTVARKVVNLSGGNQQKVVLGKWLAMRPRLLLLDEPTRGIDVGAKAEIYRHIATLAQQGIAIIVVSSDMEEIIGISHRVAVMYERRLVEIVSGDDINQQRIAAVMTGNQLSSV